MNEPTCSLCHDVLGSHEDQVACPSCASIAHAECWRENGGCGAYGCPEAPALEKQVAAASPSWWGRDVKECPQCGREIKAAALKCRHCGALFETAAPVTPEAFAESQGRRAGGGRSWGTGLFVAGLVPFLAPLALLLGLVLFAGNPEKARRLTPLQRVLGRLGTGLGAAWVLVGLLVWALSRGAGS